MFRQKFVHMVCLRERTPTALLIASRRGILAILTFLGEFEIVTTGFTIVDFHVGYFFHYGAVSKQSVIQFPPT